MPVHAGPGAPPRPPLRVNLLTAAPSVVAVSSTVANAKIVPAHLVDGDLSTAWNSRTGDLEAAWIGARVPASAHVTTIRMTVGFTAIDPKLGDLFTKNPRIRSVRVLRDGVIVAVQTLDPNARILQDIPIDQPGGDYKVEVVDIVSGSSASWREICVSEFEVWGTLAPGASMRQSKPTVRVGSFDLSPRATPEACVTAMFPTARHGAVVLDDGPESITAARVFALSPTLSVCRVEHTRERRVAGPAAPDPGANGSAGEEPAVNDLNLMGEAAVVEEVYSDTVIELAPIVCASRCTSGEPLTAVTNTQFLAMKLVPGGIGPGDMSHEEHAVAVTVVPLIRGENALLVEVAKHKFGVALNVTDTTSTLYRVTPAGLAPVLSYEAQSSRDYEQHTSVHGQCRLVPPKSLGSQPPPLVVTCESIEVTDPPANQRTVLERLSKRYVWEDDMVSYQPQSEAP